VRNNIPWSTDRRGQLGIYASHAHTKGGVVILENSDKEKRIKKEVTRLKKIIKNIPKDTMNAVLSLINNAAFMTVTLADLQETINTEGATTKYQNGENQWGTKKSPEVEIYNTMIKNHASIIKQLTDLIPDQPPAPPAKPPEPDAFEKIRMRGKNG